MLYFCSCFLQLHAQTEGRKRFGIGTFTWNVIEELVVLFGVLAITEKELPFWVLYGVWILIPITGSFSNYTSTRKVKTILSLITMCIGIFGWWIWTWTDAEDQISVEWISIGLIYLVLFTYFFVLLHPENRISKIISCLDFSSSIRGGRSNR